MRAAITPIATMTDTAMTIYELLAAPFVDYSFMRRALAACIILAISGAPLGVFLNLRRMALLGDAMSHAILPGVALAFTIWGLAVWPMTLAALAMGIAVACVAVVLTRVTQLREDGSFTLIYLLCLATGMIMISRAGSGVDVLHILFGNILGIDNAALYLAAIVASVTVVALSQIYRALVIECMDPGFLHATLRGRSFVGQAFFVLVVANLVASFQALGTLMALGLILLPAIATPFWTRSLDKAIALGIGIAALGAYAGLLVSYHASLPAGPAVVMVTGGLCVFSVLAGRYRSVRSHLAQ